jgi:hypothetical protein
VFVWVLGRLGCVVVGGDAGVMACMYVYRCCRGGRMTWVRRSAAPHGCAGRMGRCCDAFLDICDALARWMSCPADMRMTTPVTDHDGPRHTHREQKEKTAPCVKMSLFNRVLSLLRYCNESAAPPDNSSSL